MAVDNSNEGGPPPSVRAKISYYSEVDVVKAELEHERSLRALDGKRHMQAMARLEKQLQFALEETNDAKSLMEEMKFEHDRHVDQLKNARAAAQHELNTVQAELDQVRADNAARALEDDPRIGRLQDDLEASADENEALKTTIEELRTEMRRLLERGEGASTSSSGTMTAVDGGGSSLDLGAASEARPEVLRELNKVRVALAESERKNRQYKRGAEELQRTMKQLVHEKETARSASRRAEQLEAKLADETQRRETLSAQLIAWKDFEVAVAKQLGTPKVHSYDPSIPPTVSVLNEYLNAWKAKNSDSESERIALKNQLEKSRETVQPMEVQARDFNRKEEVWKQDRDDLQKSIERAHMDIKLLKGQENIYKREVESLRSIVKTFDALPLGMTQDSSTSTKSVSAAEVRLLETALSAAQEEVAVVKEGQKSLQNDLTSALSEKAELHKTYSAVVDKFGKLKEALYAERVKAEKAEQRALEAEVLSGKGSFNPQETRVLHLSNNPLTAALKEEIIVLRKQVEVLSGGDKKSKLAASDVDPNKLHQRLKQSFKEQIGRFREGVYLMTGYKVRTRFIMLIPSCCAPPEDTHTFYDRPEG